jgi:hypothetical protein
MDIEQNISGHGLERIGDVQRIRPSVAKKLAEMLMMLGNDFLVEIGNFPRQFRAGEIEDEGARDDRHLDREKLVVVQNKLRDVMTGDLSNLFFGNPSVPWCARLYHPARRPRPTYLCTVARDEGGTLR